MTRDPSYELTPVFWSDTTRMTFWSMSDSGTVAVMVRSE